MDYAKERNYIVAKENGVVVASMNISTGEYYGKKGTVVKNVPAAMSVSKITEADEFLGEAMRHYKQIFAGSIYFDDPNKARARFEELLSVGLTVFNSTDLLVEAKLTKNFVQYVKDKYYGRMCRSAVESYESMKKYACLLENQPNWVKGIVDYSYELNNLPMGYIKAFINRYILEHCDAFSNNTSDYNKARKLVGHMMSYYNKCMKMYNEVKITHNLLSNIAHINYLYEEYENAHYNEMLAKNNNLSALYYENDKYLIYPLLTREEFHAEATAQNNCVERIYMAHVKDGSTHVVVVRSKENPNKSLITCEVSNDGIIIQYLLSNNRHIEYCNEELSEEYSRLRNEYAKHLRENF